MANSDLIHHLHLCITRYSKQGCGVLIVLWDSDSAVGRVRTQDWLWP